MDGLHAVVNPLHTQHVERAPNIGRRALLARMGHPVQTQRAGFGEHVFEFLRRVADLAGIQADADEFVAKGQRLLQGFQCRLFAQMAQETQNQLRAHTQLGLGIHTGAVQAVNHHLHGHAALGVGLRIEEHFGVDHVVGGGTLQVGPGHVVEVLLVQQDAGPGVVNIQKALQIGEGVGGAQSLHAGIGQLHTVARGERKNQLGLQRAFNVDVQLGFGHGAQQLGQAVGGNGVDFEHRKIPCGWGCGQEPKL